jgi:hypothetical protein
MDKEGVTALQRAQARGHEQLVRILKDAEKRYLTSVGIRAQPAATSGSGWAAGLVRGVRPLNMTPMMHSAAPGQTGHGGVSWRINHAITAAITGARKVAIASLPASVYVSA